MYKRCVCEHGLPRVMEHVLWSVGNFQGPALTTLPAEPSCCPSSCPETGPLTELGAHPFILAGCLVSPGIHLSPPCLCSACLWGWSLSQALMFAGHAIYQVQPASSRVGKQTDSYSNPCHSFTSGHCLWGREQEDSPCWLNV